MAGPLLVDAAVPMGYTPPEGSNGVWDELLGGTLERRGWLGRPLGATRWLADEQPDLFAGRRLAELVTTNDARVTAVAERVDAVALSPAASDFSIRVSGVRLGQPSDLVVNVEASAELSPHEHADSYRMLTVAVVPSGVARASFKAQPSSPVAGQRFRGRYYFRNLAAGGYDVVIQAEGAGRISIHAIAAHAAADVAVRAYERGVILANPSHRSQLFALEKLFPATGLRRLQATSAQDAVVNNGGLVGGSVELAAKDALFLLKTAGATQTGR